MQSVTAYLGLGANLGDRLGQLQGARRALGEAGGVEVTASSGLYETEPVGGPAGQPNYLNAVLQVTTTLAPRELLACCLGVEARFGRRRGERWGARTLDVDLLLYGGMRLDLPGLTIPHPRLHERRFVLVPLAELAPTLLHPVRGRTIRQLLSDLEAPGGVTLCAPIW